MLLKSNSIPLPIQGSLPEVCSLFKERVKDVVEIASPKGRLASPRNQKG